MASLPNYLLTHRKRNTLSQEDVAFLVGINGMNKGIKVSRDENFKRIPSLQDALAYEVIYDKPIRELFAGLYEAAEWEVAKRAKVLSFSQAQKARANRAQLIARLASKLSA